MLQNAETVRMAGRVVGSGVGVTFGVGCGLNDAAGGVGDAAAPVVGSGAEAAGARTRSPEAP